jgi:predicted ATPase
MLSSLRISHFKAWTDTKDIRLAPLTVIFGSNSAGKSSLGHLLLALKQTAISSDRRRALHLGDANALIDLGTFSDCLHHHDTSKPLEFEIRWLLPKKLEIRDPLNQQKAWSGNELTLGVALRANSKTGQPETERLKYTLRSGSGDVLDASLARDERAVYALKSDQYQFVRNVGRKWPLEEPDKFYRVSDATRARFQNANFLSDLALETESMLERLYFLGPLREPPQRTYQWSGDTPNDVGPKGQYAIAAILAAKEQGRRLNRGPNKRQVDFDAFIAEWLKDLGIIESFSVRAVAEGRKEFEVLVRTKNDSAEVKITDVGFGVSQVLPALVEAFYCPRNSTVWMEQPEIHLHPQVQSELADAFISAIRARENGEPRNVQLIVESHSEHFLNRLQRRIAEGAIKPSEVAIYFCSNEAGAAELQELRVNLFGDIENWPNNFFGNEMADLTARTVAASKRRSQQG